jgi:hypothetical protein
MFDRIVVLCVVLCLPRGGLAGPETLNGRDTGYRGIWYMNQPSGDEYVFKYSGGLGTYCAKHRPLAIYRPEVNKTFFCYGGTRVGSHLKIEAAELADGRRLERKRGGFLLHMVSCYDHATGTVPRPTILLDKRTADAHDNPVLSIDDAGFLWVFSTSHGTSRPSFIHRSKRPYDITGFERIVATRRDDDRDVAIDNFSYMQPWHVPDRGFIAFFTRYKYPVQRTICAMTSPDGRRWSEWQRLSVMGAGSYQVSATKGARAGTAFNRHLKGANSRTDLYCLQTDDFGETWQTAAGEWVDLPLKDPGNAARVHDYHGENLFVYLKDISFDAARRPVILYLTSPAYQAGPTKVPRTWTTARWTGERWDIRPVTTSDSNYDTGTISIGSDGVWQIVGPTTAGPQEFNPGGEMVLWRSRDQGATWKSVRRMTNDSARNHTYARGVVNAHPDFHAIWADGDARKPSASMLYFCNRAGEVFALPETMEGPTAKPRRVE